MNVDKYNDHWDMLNDKVSQYSFNTAFTLILALLLGIYRLLIDMGENQ